MGYPTLEQVLYDLPTFVQDGDGRYFLHLQPWADRSGWNAFYGRVDIYFESDAWIIHRRLMADGVNPVDALLNLRDLMIVPDFSLAPDPQGLDETKIT